MIEGEHRVEEHEERILGVGILDAARHRNARLEPANRLVGERSDRAARESRESRHERRTVLPHQFAQRLDRPLFGDRGEAGFLEDRPAVAGGPQDQERILPEERVAGDPLAAFDALEEERVIGVLRDPQERRDRGQQVGRHLANHRHEGAAASECDELVEGRGAHVWKPSSG